MCRESPGGSCRKSKGPGTSFQVVEVKKPQDCIKTAETGKTDKPFCCYTEIRRMIMNTILYTAVTLIWGSTWLAISLQSGRAPALTSVFFRFVIASLVMLIVTVLRGELKRISRKDLFFTALQGLCLYSLNFLCFYNGVRFITGGMESLIFSIAILYNGALARIIYKESVPGGYFPALLAGLIGLVLILQKDLNLSGGEAWKGVLLCLTGTLLFSLGNMIGKRQQRAGLTVLTSNTYAMIWGTLLLSLLMIMTKTSFAIPLEMSYIAPLLYLAIPGSVITFTAYLTLVNRIGPQKASFITFMTPLIALSLSVIFEGEVLTPAIMAGALLILLGNRLLNSRKRV